MLSARGLVTQKRWVKEHVMCNEHGTLKHVHPDYPIFSSMAIHSFKLLTFLVVFRASQHYLSLRVVCTVRKVHWRFLLPDFPDGSVIQNIRMELAHCACVDTLLLTFGMKLLKCRCQKLSSYMRLSYARCVALQPLYVPCLDGLVAYSACSDQLGQTPILILEC